MRAAIAKRFSGDAAPVLLRFFRISVGSGLAGRVLVRGAQRRACIKTVTYFYGHSSKSGISKRIFITYACHVPKNGHNMSYNVLENQQKRVFYECIRQSYRL